MDLATTILLLASEDNPGRGENTSTLGGIAIIVGIILAVALAGVVLYMLMSNRRARRSGSGDGDGGSVERI